MPNSKGFRRGARSILRKKPRNRGLQPIGRLLKEYECGDKVVIMIDPSVHKGMPHPRYHGKVSVVEEKRGRAYVVKLVERGKVRTIIARPEHLKPHAS
jgi:large subunit ribosomal protein L21e